MSYSLVNTEIVQDGFHPSLRFVTQERRSVPDAEQFDVVVIGAG